MDQSVTKFMKPLVVLNPEVYELAAQTVLKGHCKFVLAIDNIGRSVDPEDTTAVAFCSAAAIIKAITVIEETNPSRDFMSINKYTKAFENFIGKVSICHWNNLSGLTPEQIAAKFREFAKTLK